MNDLIIVGGGPAGATLARLIGKRYKVLLIDRRSLTKPYTGSSMVKSCGGLLAPDAQKMLGQLGLSLPRNVVVDPQLFTVRTIDLQSQQERYYQRFYINLNREKFDRWLISLIPDSVEVRDRCLFKSFERTADGFQVHLVQDGNEVRELARMIIGADGGNSRVRKLAFPKEPTPKKYISIQEWFASSQRLPYFSAIFDAEITDFYAWTISKENRLLVGAALEPGKEAWAKFALLKEKLQNYGYQFGQRVQKDGAFIMRPLQTSQICTGNDGIGLIGEAAGWISPSSAEGFSYAMKSAMFAAQSLVLGMENFSKRYAKQSRGLKHNILLKNLKSPFMYQPFLRNMIIRSGVQSMDVMERTFFE